MKIRRRHTKSLSIAISSPDLLLEHHRQMLEVDSGIAKNVIAARGYRSITNRQELRDLGFAHSQCIVPGLLIPLYPACQRNIDLDGRRVAIYQYRPDRPRQNDKGKSIKYETPANHRPCIDVPPSMRNLLSDNRIPLLITEGSKKADAAASRGVLCISLTGVYGWITRGQDASGDSVPLPDWDSIPLQGRRIEIAFDSDIIEKHEVTLACRKLTSMLRSRGATVVVLYLPSGPEGSKTGLDDFFVRGGTVEQLHTLTHRAPLTRDPGDIDTTLPEIRTTNRQLRDLVDDCTDAVIAKNDPPLIYVRSNRLVRLVCSQSAYGEQITIETMARDSTMEHLSRVANFVSLSSSHGRTSVSPPDNAVRALLARSEYPGIPPLAGIVRSPVFAADGVLCDNPGYNPSTGMYYHVRTSLSLPDTTPTQQSIRNSVDLLLYDLLGDFPFADDASKAHVLCLILLPFMRSMIDGVTPLHLIDAPKAGTGKTLLAMTVSTLFDSQGVPARSTPTDEAEWKKQLTTWLRQGSSHIILDNVKTLRSATLESVLTSREWSDRLLGSNTDIRLPNWMAWIATSNNMVSSREQLRRCVWIRLDAKTERPDERKSFRHADLHFWVLENRDRLVGAVVTLIRSWIDAGQPGYSGRYVLGSFEVWTRVMGGLLETIGVPGFLANQRQLIEEADDDGAQLAAFVGKWWNDHQGRAVTASTLLPLALKHFEAELSGRSPSRSLGRMLTRHRDNVVGDKIIRVKPDQKSGSMYFLSSNESGEP